MDRNKKPAAGGNRRAGREFDSRRYSTASLVLSLRTCPWRADEALGATCPRHTPTQPGDMPRGAA